jgi:hypothetical protein
MSKYKYYSLGNESKETMGVIEANSLVEATLLASIQKRLSLSQFEKIFGVEKINTNEGNKSRTKEII